MSRIKVDFEWAYQEVVSTNDFSKKDPGWVKSYVESWCEGFLEGYMQGRVETSIRIICNLKKSGMPAERIAKYTGVSESVIEMM